MNFLYISFAASAAALLFAIVRYFAIMKRDDGNEVMRDIA
jgi:Na+/H+-translocating membrane pyrophosphatase